MSSRNFDEFQRILQQSRPPFPESSSKRRISYEEEAAADYVEEERTHPARTACDNPFGPLLSNNDKPRVLRLTDSWYRPNCDFSSPHLVRNTQWEIFSQPWTKWEPFHTGTQVLLPTVPDLHNYAPRPTEELSSSSESSVERAPRLWLPISEHLIHGRFLSPSGSKTTEWLRIDRRSSISQFIRSQNLTSGIFEESHDPDYVAIPASRFPALFFMKESLQSRITELEKTTNRHEKHQLDELELFFAFIDDLFHNAQLKQSSMRQNGQVSFDYLWTLFPPCQILYEKRSLPFCDETYEQCLRILSIEKVRSYFDGESVWHLTLEDVVYRPELGIGPCIVTTHRYIRPFLGMKAITDECIGLVPLDMIPRDERISLIARLSDIGRRYIAICSQPWTIWEYEGPVLFSHPTFNRHIREEKGVSPDNKPWQRYTGERVIVDAIVSQHAYENNVDDDGWVDEFADQRRSEAEPLSLEMDSSLEDLQCHAARTEELYLICRSHVPAFLLNSGAHAMGILVSLLRCPTWGRIHKTTALSHRTKTLRDLNLWESVVGDFMSSERSDHRKRPGRPIRCPGLVLLFQGPQRITRDITASGFSHVQASIHTQGCLLFQALLLTKWPGIAENLQKPLVMTRESDSSKDIHVTLRNALRWEGVVLVEDQLLFSEIYHERFATHPGVVFLTSDKPEEIPERCFSVIDAVIDCNAKAYDCWEVGSSNNRGLWHHYLVDKLPELVEVTPVERLRMVAEILASVESREARMAKTLLTAKRLAQSTGEAVKEGHIFEVIRQALAPKDVSEFESQLERLDERPSDIDGREEHVSGL